MGNGCTKACENIYFQARKKASESNDALRSREGAAERLGVSVSTLADYELGNTKVVPVDKVVLMADLYGSPELENCYCKNECPIGKEKPIATGTNGIEGAVLRLVREFDTGTVNNMKQKLVDIAADGKVTDDEQQMLEYLLGWADDMMFALSEMKLAGNKALKG